MSIDDKLVVLSQREGASSRTADELAAVFLWDAAVLTFPKERDITHHLNGVSYCNECHMHNCKPMEEWVMEWDERFTPDMIEACLDAIENGWCEDPENGQYLSELIQTGEGWLADNSMTVWWNDGYVIYDTSEWTDEEWEEVENW
jgi:hypothetical protein